MMLALASIQVPQAVKQLDKDYRLETLEYELLALALPNVLLLRKWQISGRSLNASLTCSHSIIVLEIKNILMLSGDVGERD